MLVNLHVRNMALIEEADIDLTGGLTILTGETGAGKSIIIGSVNAALGGKVSADIIRKGAEYALAELTFHVDDDNRLKCLKKLGVEDCDGGDVIISRRIMPSRSVIKVNGVTVTAAFVRKMASLLIDIHGQHEHQSLLDEERHLELVDRFLDDDARRIKAELASAYAEYDRLRKAYAEFDIDDEARNRETAFLAHEVQEIEDAALKPGEDEELESTFRRMSNFQKIMGELAGINTMMNEGEEDTAGTLIGRSLRCMETVATLDGKASGLHTLLAEIDSLTQDFGRDLTSYMDSLDFDEAVYEETRERLDLINGLKMKYGNTIEKVNSYGEECRRKLDEYENFDERKSELKAELDRALVILNEMCGSLSECRKKAALGLESDIALALKELNFLDSRFKAVFTRRSSVTANGYDSICFMIATNPGEDLKPLAKIASGGEMSRIMLAIKSALAEKDDIDSLIFDEIDTGISGRTAQMVAVKMHSIAASHQVICITHLPQIAAMADTHFMIEKSASDNRTTTTIKRLNEQESVCELARLLGGSELTEAVMANAREMRSAVHR